MKTLFATALFLLPASLAAQPALQKIWETDGLRVPESVLVYQHDNEKFLFVSEIDGKGDEADGKGGVARLSTDGKILEHNWVRGLNAPKGLATYQGKLYVADLTEVVVIDIATATVEQKIPAEDAIFLNDVTVDEKGIVYVSDTRKNRVYRLENNTISIWLEDIEAANGLKVIEGDLYIAANDKLLKSDGEKNITEIASGFEQRADGLEPIGNGDFLVTCWAGIIYYVYADGRIEKLADTQQEKVNTADLGWDPQTQTLYVPTFFTNSVIAFKLKQR